MNVRGLKNRLLKIERRILQCDDGTFTLEELCRSMWHQDKRKFLEIANGSNLSLFARQFELDAAERAATDRQMRPQE